MWSVLYYFPAGRRSEVYSGSNGTVANYYFQHYSVTGALRSELLKDGQLYDCRGVAYCNPVLTDVSALAFR